MAIYNRFREENKQKGPHPTSLCNDEAGVSTMRTVQNYMHKENKGHPQY